MGGLECVITGVMDEFKDFFQRHKISREIFTGLVVFSSFLVAISCVTPVRLISKLFLTFWDLITFNFFLSFKLTFVQERTIEGLQGLDITNQNIFIILSCF